MAQQPPVPRRRFVRRSPVAPTLSVVPSPVGDPTRPVIAQGPRAIKLSILMPAYNEARTLAHVVDTVLTTTFPCDFELIVVDDGSSDATPEILAAVEHP